MELLDIFDINGNHLGTKTREECHTADAGVYHKAIWTWIINDKGQLLVQQRSATKKKSPLKWDMPSAGHVDAGESCIDTCIRETKEELGLDTTAGDYIFLKQWINTRGLELAQVYLLKTTATLQDLVLQTEEVAQVKYLNYNEFVKLIYSNDFCEHSIEYKDWIVKTLKQYI